VSVRLVLLSTSVGTASAWTAFGGSSPPTDLGSTININPLHHESQPLKVSDAVRQGYAPVQNKCIKGLGYPYAMGGKPSTSRATTLYYSAGGQLSGYGISIFGKANKALHGMVSRGYYKKSHDDDSYIMSLGFREGHSEICDEKHTFEETVGTALVINPQSIAKKVPLTKDRAESESYHQGACIVGMGVHYIKDNKKAPDISWDGGALEPVVPMYDYGTGKLRSVFLSTPTKEYIPWFGTNGWDRPPEPDGNKVMCWNFCSESCPFSGADNWHTSHLFFVSMGNAMTTTCPAEFRSCLSFMKGAPFPPMAGMGMKCCPGDYYPVKEELRRSLVEEDNVKGANHTLKLNNATLAPKNETR